MKGDGDKPGFAVSQTIYGWLLRAYPAAYRDAYGPFMTQLFRDQCRDAWEMSRGWGLINLWLRVLPDLVNTALVERWESFSERKTMNEKIANVSRPASVPAIFKPVFLTVLLLVVMSGVVVTFLLPEAYASAARVKIPVAVPPGTVQPLTYGYDPSILQLNAELITSAKVLEPVVAAMNLNTVWGKKYNAGGALKTAGTVALLRSRLEVKPVGDTMLMEIKVYSDDSREAADLANAIAKSYQEYEQTAASSGGGVQIVDTAEPGYAPVRPNKPLNIAISLVCGVIMASVVAMVASVIVAGGGKRRMV